MNQSTIQAWMPVWNTGYILLLISSPLFRCLMHLKSSMNAPMINAAQKETLGNAFLNKINYKFLCERAERFQEEISSS